MNKFILAANGFIKKRSAIVLAVPPNCSRLLRITNCLAGSGLALLSFWAGLCPSALAQNANSISIIQKGFDGFKHGSFGDSGANIYLSAKGIIETIHRWDLNRDGELDLVFTQDHNHDYSPDAMIYWGGVGGPESLQPELPEYRSAYTLLKHAEHALKKVTWLPSLGGGRVQIADLNNDGYLDIVSGNMMHNFRQDMPAYIYWGSARGFKESDRTILPAYIASGIAVGDLNDDGLPDVVLANEGYERGFDVRFGPMINNKESYIYWGQPTGFDVSRRTALPTISAADVAVGDFNGDKHLDLAFVNNLRTEQSVYVYWGDGSSAFSETSRQVLRLGETDASKSPQIFEMNTLLASDLNSDGLTDLVVAGTRQAKIFIGAQSGLTATGAADLPTENCFGLEAADLNRDGRIDLIVANAGAEANLPKSTIYWGSGNGYSVDRKTQLATLGAMSVKAADLNNDGFPDLLFGNVNTSQGVPAQIFWGSPNGFADNNRRELQAFGAIGVGVADLDRDGHQDVVLLNHLSGSGERSLPTSIYWGNKEHRYSSASVTQLQPGGYMMYTVADFDDNGYPDLVLVVSGHPWIWWGSELGYNAKNRTEVPLPSGGDAISALNVADLNRDGYLDLVCVGRLGQNPKEGAPNAFIMYGGGDHFRIARTEKILLAVGASSLAIADLNKDGYLDLIFPLQDIGHSQIRWGGPQGYTSARFTTVETNGADLAAVADLDEDGWLDVIFTSGLMGKRQTGQPVVGGTGVQGTTRNSHAFIYWGSPMGSFLERTQIENYNALDVTVADLNRDGHLDLAFSSYLSDTTRELPAIIYWGDSRRGYTEKQRTFLDAASSSSMDALDLNHDGWLDLVVTNHQKNFSHLSGTNIYWGGKQGYSISQRTNIPTIGSHLDAMVDAGNIYTRKYEWDYSSAPIEAVADMHFSQLRWEAETELGTGVKFQVRSAATQTDLAKAKWSGPEGPDSYYSVSGAGLTGVEAKHRWLQYRAILTAPDGGNSPNLTQVEIVCARR